MFALLAFAAFALPAPQQLAPTAEGTPWRSAAQPSGAPDVPSVYMYDDGTPDQTVGWGTLAADVVWMQYFDPVGGADTLTQIATMNGRIGSSNAVAVGTQGYVVVWDDVNNDGNPLDCTVLTVAPWTVQYMGQNIFEPIPISPTVVTSRFFIGAWVQGQLGNYPAPLDNSVQSMGRAWITGAASGTFNPNVIGCCYGMWEVGGGGVMFDGVWSLRAEGTGNVATPFCTAKSGLACGTPTMQGVGVPSVSATSGYVVRAGPARSCKSGILMYNTSVFTPGVPFQGGTLCVNPAGVRRAGPTNSGGTPGGASCDGEFVIDMVTFASGAWSVPDCAGMPSGLPPNNPAAFLTNVGQSIYCQFWGRDSVATGSFVSSGVEYVVEP